MNENPFYQFECQNCGLVLESYSNSVGPACVCGGRFRNVGAVFGEPTKPGAVDNKGVLRRWKGFNPPEEGPTSEQLKEMTDAQIEQEVASLIADLEHTLHVEAEMDRYTEGV